MFHALFTKTDEYKKLAQALGTPGACALFGIPGAGRALVYAALSHALDKPLCIVTPGEAEATRFAGDLNALGVAAAVFPARDYVLRPIEGTGREYEYRRLAVLGDLVGGRLQAVCVPDEGLTQYTTPRAEFCANTRTLHPGDTLPRAVRRGLHPARPGGRPGPVFHPRRYCGHLRAGYEAARPSRVLGR